MSAYAPINLETAVPVEDQGSFACRATLIEPACLSAGQKEAWTRLYRSCPDANVFARPWFVAAGLAHCDPEGAVLLLVAQDERGWLGVLPVQRCQWLGNAPLPHIAEWQHANQFLSAALIRPGAEARFWTAALAFLDRRSEISLVLNNLPTDEPAFAGLEEVCRTGDRPLVFLRGLPRPVLRSGDVNDQASPAGATRKQRSRVRALAERAARDLGCLRIDTPGSAKELATWTEAFLSLEQAGWKGRAGSSLAACPRTADFFRAVMASGWQDGSVRAMSLVAGDTVLAHSTYFSSGGAAWGFKKTFDERFARYGPGVILLREITGIAAREGLILFDSGSSADCQPVASFWPERRTLVQCAVGLGQRRRKVLLGLTAAAQLWSRLKQSVPARPPARVQPS